MAFLFDHYKYFLKEDFSIWSFWKTFVCTLQINIPIMKASSIIFAGILVCLSCNKQREQEIIKEDIFNTEKEFEKMASEKGIAEAFYHFADKNAVINRDTLIKGKENIKDFYARERFRNAEVTWTPDFVDVSECGTLGYTYGKFTWKVPSDSGKVSEFSGIFHTVWKKQKDGSWRYVWD